MKENAANIIDLRGTILPVAMLEFIRAFDHLKPDGIMEVLVSDRETRDDLFKVLQASSYALVGVAEKRSFSRICLKKKAANYKQGASPIGGAPSNNLKEEEK